MPSSEDHVPENQWHRPLGIGESGGVLHSLSGDWTEIAPGVRARLNDAPTEEDMVHYQPHGVVILEVVSTPVHHVHDDDSAGGA